MLLFPVHRDSSQRPASLANLEAFAATELNDFFFGQTAASRCEGLPTFRDLTPSPSSGRTGGLVETKLMTRSPTLRYVYLPSAGCGVERDPSV